MRILTVLPDVPLPADTGLHLRMLGNLELIRSLGHDSHVLFFSTEERLESLNLLDEVAEYVDGQRHAGLRRAYSDFNTASLLGHKVDFLVRGILRLPGHVYPFSMRYDAVGALLSVIEEARAVHADVVVIPSFCLHWAAALSEAGFPVIADAIDVLTDLTRRIVTSYGGRNPVQRLSLFANAVASHTQERLFFPICAEVWATSWAEASRVRELSPCTRTVVVPNTVPDRGIAHSVDDGSFSLGFLGTFSSLPNLEAANKLVEEIFPLVRAAVPDAILRLAGSGLPDHMATRWRNTPGIEVLGRVVSSSEFLAACNVIVLPVRVRGGVPLKLIESLSQCRPVVTFPELVVGLPLEPGRDIEVAADAAACAVVIVDLLRDRDRAECLGRAGRLAYEVNFSRDALGRDAREHSLLGSGR